MVKRQCPKCNAIFERKSHYDYHINRKFDCSPNINHKTIPNNNSKICENLQEICRNSHSEKNNVEQNVKKSSSITNSNTNNILDVEDLTLFSCSYCNKTYSSKYTLERHLNENCKIKKSNDNEKENIFKLLLEKDKEKDRKINELENQNKLLMEKIDKLISLKSNSKSSKTINNNNQTTNNNNTISITNNDNSIKQNNQIIMVNFGKEDLSIIDKKLFVDRIIKNNLVSGVKIPDEVLKIIHFNPMYPQLSNIYISDINRDKCMVYEDGEWKLSNIDNVPQIIDKICLFSNEQITYLRDKYPNNKPLNDRLNVIEKYNNLIDNDYLEELKDDIEVNKNEIKRCEGFQKLTLSTIKKTLYNEGKKIKKTIKN